MVVVVKGVLVAGKVSWMDLYCFFCWKAQGLW